VHAHPRLRRIAAAVLLGIVALACGPAASSQAEAMPAAGGCDGSLLGQPFARWADLNQYALAPSGDFEDAASGWSLSGPVAVVAGSEPWGATGSIGSRSLSLVSSGQALSRPICVSAAYPKFRLFARGGTAGSVLLISVLYPTVLGPAELAVGLIAPSASWSPTAPMSTVSAIVGALGGATASMQLRFTELQGTAQIDDVFVDPHGLG
jgi:hypothetical protein